MQTPGGISIFYDVGQGQGWQRNIVMNGSPHLPDSIRQWYGDLRGHWEGNTLVVDVTNFSPKTDFRGARENLHLVERWTRTAPTSSNIGHGRRSDRVDAAMDRQGRFQQAERRGERIDYEPRCIEGNMGLPGMLHGWPMEERAFAERRVPDRQRDVGGGACAGARSGEQLGARRAARGTRARGEEREPAARYSSRNQASRNASA